MLPFFIVAAYIVLTIKQMNADAAVTGTDKAAKKADAKSLRDTLAAALDQLSA